VPCKVHKWKDDMTRSPARLTLLTVVLLCLAFAGCGHKLTEAEQQQLTKMKADLQTVQVELAEAKVQQTMYSGGLLKSLLELRTEVLKTNEALLEQRVHALESGAKITVVVQAAQEDPIRAAQLAAEIDGQKIKLARANAEAARYSGGLIQVISLVSAATVQNTVAMLEQQQLMAKYGLGLPMLPKGEAVSK
jgi:hypothetical protein